MFTHSRVEKICKNSFSLRRMIFIPIHSGSNKNLISSPEMKADLFFYTLYTGILFIAEGLKSQYVFIENKSNIAAMLVNKIIMRVNKSILLDYKIILLDYLTLKTYNIAFMFGNIAIETSNIAVMWDNLMVKSYFKIILLDFISAMLDNLAAMLDLFSMKTYWLFALFTHQNELLTFKNKQMASSTYRIYDVRNIFMPSEQLLTILTDRPDYRDRQ
jgi:hypothetical protein